MLIINNKPADAAVLAGDYPEDSAARTVIDTLAASDKKYYYDSLDELQFELRLREEIISASRRLHKSNMGFEVFRESRANPDYWIRRDNGGFSLKNGVKASDAVRDIYESSSKYGTECATAMQIVYLGALLEIFPEDAFNRMFKNLYLMNWNNVSRYLRDTATMHRQDDYLPGDRRYFANPDVNPETPEWQGENTIDLDGELYYGHGMGIHKAERIIRELNQNRKRNAGRDAYLMDSAARPDFKRLFALYQDATQNASVTRLTA